MKRSLSYVLVALGLFLAGRGLESIWTTRQEETKAQEQWDHDAAAPSTFVDPSRRINKGDLLARLSIKRLKTKWVVIEGADDAELHRGPGHVVDTAFPGSFGNCVIAAHRDTEFGMLRYVKIGERITLERGGRRFVYRVTNRSIVAPDDTESLKPTYNPTLTLVTCYPFFYVGPAPKRFVVRAELISSTRLRA